MSLSVDEKANVILGRALDAISDHADQYPSADQRLRGVATATLMGVAFATVVRTNGWLFALRATVGSLVVALRYPQLDALKDTHNDR